MLVIVLDFAACGNRKALRLRAKGVPPVNDRVRMSQTTKRVPYDAIVSSNDYVCISTSLQQQCKWHDTEKQICSKGITCWHLPTKRLRPLLKHRAISSGQWHRPLLLHTQSNSALLSHHYCFISHTYIASQNATGRSSPTDLSKGYREKRIFAHNSMDIYGIEHP